MGVTIGELFFNFSQARTNSFSFASTVENSHFWLKTCVTTNAAAASESSIFGYAPQC
jgi:hypothetical protein